MEIKVPEKVSQFVQKRRNVCWEAAKKEHVTAKKVYVPAGDGRIRCLVYRPERNEDNLPVFFDIHGGGFNHDVPEADNIFCRKIIAALDVCVISPDYRLAPEFPYPQGQLDVYDVIKYVYANPGEFGIDSKRMAIGGHSAGGNFAAAICLREAKEKEINFCCQILDYPVLDMYTPAADKFYVKGAVPPDISELFNLCYRLPEQAKEIYFSPIFAEDDLLRELPPALVITAELDSLRDEAEQYALRMAKNGVEVTMMRFQSVAHGFTVNGRDDTEADRAHRMMIGMLRRYLF